MKDKINVAELLKDCPKGMELDCTMFERVFFERVDKQGDYPIAIRVGKADIKHITKEGCWNKYSNAKCVIFPKGKTTWEGFHRPFKDGDIIFTHGGKYNRVSIFKQFSGSSCYTYVDLCMTNNDLFTGTSSCLCTIEEIDTQRLATEEEKEKLFQAIKDNGYRWNPETKTLEKLIKPKFKVGDRIRHKCPEFRGERTITNCDDTVYFTTINDWISIKHQDDWELVPNKFDLITLIPFESRVLVRDYDTQIWIPTFWGKHLKDDSNSSYLTTNGCYKYCIPYEGNEHLLGTTEDCDEYFKTWE